ncbi:LysR family transcriptional regulator [Aliishimia ponticola]|uniref:LysR family transcriptional regulator n=1 Tax=Aliishimia ponticola TaxID=2499833 RepID=A0A4S4NDJ0_9RHOB|nr:LysR family transcriptional regulator [Aliishimia ponticola]THH36815.1 LysR family transcriptional regulator [Aliishimia ponticola]
MDQSSTDFDWSHMRAFLATAETGSLSAAARVLGLTQPTLGRQVAALEQALGVTLFERAGRSLTLTQTGTDLLPHARQMAKAAAHLSLIATSQSQSIEGEIRVTASDVFSAYLMPDVLRQVQEHAPRLHVELVATNDLADLIRREADIAIRHVRPTEPELIARRLTDTTAHLYAASSYLDARGAPLGAADLAGHDFVGFADNARLIAHLAEIGIPVTPDNFRIGSQNALVAWRLVQQGFGIAPMADAVARDTPGIVRVLPDMPPIVFPVWLVTHRELHTSRRIRLVFDILAETLAQI